MTMTVVEKISKLYEDQRNGVQMKCPRCGENWLGKELFMNALSRRCSLYICSECGTNEALIDYFGGNEEVEDWAAFEECE